MDSSGSIVYANDDGWMTPRVKGASVSPRHRKLYEHFAGPGLVCSLGGLDLVFLVEHNVWDNLAASQSVVSLNLAMGIENATVNYDTSFSPYINYVSKFCGVRQASYPPTSACIGTVRLAMTLDEASNTIKFELCPPLIEGDLHGCILSLPYQPIATDKLPVSFTFPGKSTILNFISPFYPDVRDLLTMMWIIGNSVHDPLVRPRTVMLAGPGGSGKSTVLKVVQRAMKGCASMIPDGSLTSKSDKMSHEVAVAVVSSRMVVCYDVDLEKRHMNLSTFKNITGGDNVKVGDVYTKSCCSLILATNGLPDAVEEPLYRSDAVIRRLVIVPMEVDVFGYDPEMENESAGAEHLALEPNDPVDYLDFICACLYIRTKHTHLPLSPMTMLLTLTASQYPLACDHIEECVDRGPTRAEACTVLGILSRILDCSEPQVITKCRLISRTCVVRDGNTQFIRGLRPRYAKSSGHRGGSGEHRR